MRAVQTRSTASAAAVLIAAVFILGCGGGTTPEDATIERSQFKTLTLAYLGFLSANKGKLPKSEEEFRHYIDRGIGDKLRDQDLTLDEIFVSPRDGKPYVFVYRENLTQANRRIIGYEQEGIDGRRYVSDRSGAVMDVSENEFQRMTASRN